MILFESSHSCYFPFAVTPEQYHMAVQGAGTVHVIRQPFTQSLAPHINLPNSLVTKSATSVGAATSCVPHTVMPNSSPGDSTQLLTPKTIRIPPPQSAGVQYSHGSNSQQPPGVSVGRLILDATNTSSIATANQIPAISAFLQGDK